jgi:mannosylglycoprotein endo-beta-mannosidase
MWTKYTGVLIWKTQNPWTGLRGQFYDHLHDQTAGFYGCRCAAEPVHVQLNLATYFIEVVNTTADELSDMAVEISVWDLDGACPYYKVTEKMSVPPKKVKQVVEMKYPKSKNAKSVYFLLIKLFRVSDTAIVSRNFYWLHLSGEDYTLLEEYRTKKVPLKITSDVLVSGSKYKVKMHLENSSTNLNSKPLALNKTDDKDNSQAQLAEDFTKQMKKPSPWRRIFGGDVISSTRNHRKISKINGTDTGVAFFLNCSVHGAKKDHGNNGYEDTRILPVHYSDNYFSLVPGETMNVDLSFEVPEGVVPRVLLTGWNYSERHTIL